MADKYAVYVSAAAEGTIDVFVLDGATGALDPVERVTAGPMVMPLSLAPGGRHLYAAIRSEPFRVASYAIAPSTGRLTPIATAPLTASMASLATDRTGRWLLAASYGDSCATVSAIDPDGAVRSPPHQRVATGRHAHAIGTDRTNTSVVVPCLGDDLVMVWRFDAASGTLSAPSSWQAAAGHGPRHTRVSADNRFVYVLGELSGHVSVLERGSNGMLGAIQSAVTIPESMGLAPGRVSAPVTHGQPVAPMPERRIWCADIHLAPDGRHLYTSERTTSTIAHSVVDPATGRVRHIASYETARQPRGFAITPGGRWLIAAGEKDDRLAIHAIDPTTGHLDRHDGPKVGAGANWVEIVALSKDGAP